MAQPNISVNLRLEEWLGRRQRQNGVADVPELRSAIGTDLGSVRKDNQDQVVVARMASGSTSQKTMVVAVLCDGMGGMLAGRECAILATSQILSHLFLGIDGNLADTLAGAVDAANQVVYDRYKGRGGSTLVALVITESATIGASVGDSRIYLRDQSSLTQISVDDTIAGELSRLKGQPIETKDLDSTSRLLAQFVGMGDGVEPRLYFFPPDESDRSFLLISDGVHRLPQKVVADVLNASPNQMVAVNRLLATARYVGGVDNASVAYVACRQEFSPRSDSTGLPVLEVWDATAKLDLLIFQPELPVARIKQPILHDASESKARSREIDQDSPSKNGVAPTRKRRGRDNFGQPRNPSKTPDHPQRELEIAIDRDTPKVDEVQKVEPFVHEGGV